MIVIEFKKRVLARGFRTDIDVGWDGGQDEPNRTRELHDVKFRAGGKAVVKQLSDEAVADFPGQVGTALTMAIIKEAVEELAL